MVAAYQASRYLFEGKKMKEETTMEYAIKDRVFVITGASGGMGSVISRMIAKEGGKLALCSNDEARMEELKKDLPADTLTAILDITKEEEVAAFFEQVKKQFGGADALLNLAGLSIPAQIPEMAEKDYELTMDVNLKGTFLASKYFAPLAKENAQIVNIGSMAALRANGNAPLYCTAKAAVNMFASGLQIQVAKQDIRVTTLNPGGADTPFWGNRKVAREKLLQAADVCAVMRFVLTSDPRIVFHELNFESFAMIKG